MKLYANNLPQYDGKMGIQNYLKKYGLKNAEEMYLLLNDIQTPPKCLYCDNKCKFISFFKGYKQHCGSKLHKKIIIENSFIIKRRTQEAYDNFILKNRFFYENTSFPFIDIYDGTYIKNLKHLKKRSYTALKILNTEHKCVGCGSTIIKNKLRNQISDYCSNHKCYQNKKIIQIKSLYPLLSDKIIKLFIKNENHDIKYLNDLFIRYGEEFVYNYLKGNIIFYKNYILKKRWASTIFSFKQNNILNECVLKNCKICNKQYVYKDKRIDKNGMVTFKKIGAEYSCSMKCYHKCLALKLWDRTEANKKNSVKMINKIKKGDFTPPATNSWTNSKKRLKYDGNNFRSSWELYFYLYNKIIKDNKLSFEKLRILYYNSTDKIKRNYIPDFIDDKHKIIYEIKPSCNFKNFKDKEKSILKYCDENGYKFVKVTEEWFYNNYDVKLIEKIDNDNKITLKRCLKMFERNN